MISPATQRLPMLFQTRENGRVIGAGRLVARHDDDVGGAQIRPCSSKALSNQSLEPISVGRATNPLLGYRQAKARIPQSVGSVEDREQIIGRSAPVTEYPVEFGCRR